MCYNFATFVLYLDVITLIYRENRLTSSETSLSAELTGQNRTMNSQVPQIQRFVGLFLFHYLCPIGYYLALYRIRIYTLVLTELQYICAILEQII